jgi:hypothetical protein
MAAAKLVLRAATATMKDGSCDGSSCSVMKTVSILGCVPAIPPQPLGLKLMRVSIVFKKSPPHESETKRKKEEEKI